MACHSNIISTTSINPTNLSNNIPPKKIPRKHKRNPTKNQHRSKYNPNKTHDKSNQTVKYQAIFSNLLDLSKPSSQLSMSGLSFHVGRGTKRSIFLWLQWCKLYGNILHILHVMKSGMKHIFIIRIYIHVFHFY